LLALGLYRLLLRHSALLGLGFASVQSTQLALNFLVKRSNASAQDLPVTAELCHLRARELVGGGGRLWLFLFWHTIQR
jgi:hypothetical protein